MTTKSCLHLCFLTNSTCLLSDCHACNLNLTNYVTFSNRPDEDSIICQTRRHRIRNELIFPIQIKQKIVDPLNKLEKQKSMNLLRYKT